MGLPSATIIYSIFVGSALQFGKSGRILQLQCEAELQGFKKANINLLLILFQMPLFVICRQAVKSVPEAGRGIGGGRSAFHTPHLDHHLLSPISPPLPFLPSGSPPVWA